MSKLFKHVASCVAIPAFLALAAGSGETKRSQAPDNPARGSLVSKDYSPEIFIKNDGSMDAGYTAKTVVRNTGVGPGTINVRVVLRTNEGDFERSREVTFTASESREMVWQFAEPSAGVTAKDLQVFLSP